MTERAEARNIRDYLDAHADQSLGPVNPVSRVMKINEPVGKDRMAMADAALRAAEELRDTPLQ